MCCPPGCTCGRHTVSAETRAKLSAAWRPHSAETRAKISEAKKGTLTGSDNPNWRGDEAGYGPKHKALCNHFPKTGICERCKKDVGTTRPTGTEYAFLRHPAPPTRNIEDYAELCLPCHRHMDRHDEKVRSFGIRVVRVRHRETAQPA
jgi:hypothetical protein